MSLYATYDFFLSKFIWVALFNNAANIFKYFEKYLNVLKAVLGVTRY